MQFEIDSPFQIYRPFSHYRIRSLKEEKFAWKCVQVIMSHVDIIKCKARRNNTPV
jgi:hypothetical protein